MLAARRIISIHFISFCSKHIKRAKSRLLLRTKYGLQAVRMMPGRLLIRDIDVETLSHAMRQDIIFIWGGCFLITSRFFGHLIDADFSRFFAYADDEEDKRSRRHLYARSCVLTLNLATTYDEFSRHIRPRCVAGRFLSRVKSLMLSR